MRQLAAALVALLLGATACGAISEPGEPASIAFDSLPSPAVVIGDSLRDEAGNAVPLRARVFDGRGSEMEDAPVEYFLLDRGATLTPEGYIIGDSLRTGIRVVASIGGIQSVVRLLTVTLRPDAIEATIDTVQVIEYDPIAPINSTLLSVRVVHQEPTGGELPVQGWRVRYAVTGAAPGDTVPGFLVIGENEQLRRSLVDTTDATGVAGRSYRLIPARLTVVVDTLEVTASAQHRGEPLAGSPVRFLLILRPRGPS